MIAFTHQTPSGVNATLVQEVMTSTIYVAVLPVERKCEIKNALVVSNQVLLELKGTGTAHFRGTASYGIYKADDDQPIVEAELGSVVVLPNAITRISGNLLKSLPRGDYRLTIKIKSVESGVQGIIKSFNYALDVISY